jgi:signal transduction histidine kinase
MSVVQMGLLAAIVTPFALSIWVAFVHRPMVPNNFGAPVEAFGASALTRSGFAAETLDLEPIVRATAHALRDKASARSVRVQLAVDPGLKARVDRNSLQEALRTVVLTAVQATPGGQVLITGMSVGGQLHIRITDDGKNTDQRTRESLARDAEELIALQGGSVCVEARPGRATTVTIRLPLPGGNREELNESPAMADQAA